MRNLTGGAETVTITLEYPGEKEPQQTALAPLTLGPYATEDVALDSAFGLLPLPLPYCSIRIQYSGPPGTVVGEVSSVESKGDLVIDSRLANEGNGWAGSGGHPWRLDEETESVLFLTDMGDQPVRVGFQVQAGGVHYHLTDLRLQPHETRAIDLRKLRDAQKEDFRGNRIPGGATDGSVVWIRLEHVPVMGRLVVLERHKAMASNYDCELCLCPANYNALDVSPSILNLLPYGTGPYGATAAYFSCNYDPSYSTVTSWTDWSSSNPPVATVNNTTQKGLATGVSGGTANITGGFTDFVYTPVISWCINVSTFHNDSGGANVVVVSQTPTSFNMSTGDTKTITLAVTPASTTVNTSFTGKSPPSSNPDSSCAASLTIPGKSNVSGNVSHNVTASSAGCSGVFNSVRGSATPTGGGGTANSSNTTTANVPPQVLIRMMEAEAGGTGNNTAMQSLGDVAQNRIHSSMFNPPYSNFQNTIIPGQFATSATTTGIQPQLDLSVNVFTGAAARFCNSLAFWSPTLAQWQTVQTAINSGTTVFPGGTGAPTYSAWLTQNQQILHVSAVGTKADGRPNFLYLAYRNPTQPAAVSTSCGP